MSAYNGYRQCIQFDWPEWTVTQVDRKQLFVATHPDGDKMLFSYRTLVGRQRAGAGEQWRITTEKLSSTTTKHCNWYARQVNAVRVADLV